MLLHNSAFTQRHLFTQSRFYTLQNRNLYQNCLRSEKVRPAVSISQFNFSFWPSTLIPCERAALCPSKFAYHLALWWTSPCCPCRCRWHYRCFVGAHWSWSLTCEDVCRWCRLWCRRLCRWCRWWRWCRKYVYVDDLDMYVIQMIWRLRKWCRRWCSWCGCRMCDDDDDDLRIWGFEDLRMRMKAIMKLKLM